MVSYASLQSSIATAVDDYESYKSQSLRYNFDTLSLGASQIKPATPSHAKRGSLSIPALTRLGSKDNIERPRTNRTASNDRIRSSRSDNGRSESGRPQTGRVGSSDSFARQPARGEFAAFITVARDHEYATHAIDLDFLSTVLDFIRSEHPYTSNSLKSAIKARQMQKKKLWMKYTTQMQGLAKSYSSGGTMPAPSPFDSASSSDKGDISNKREECKRLIGRLDSKERTCGESLLSALNHFHVQAMRDIDARYSMPDPIHDKTTPVEKHNERVRVFNQLVKFVADDLGRIEKETRSSNGEVYPASSKKDKKGSGAVEAVESFCVDDYPPYK